MKIRIDRHHTLRTDAYNFVLERGSVRCYWADLPPVIERLRTTGCDARSVEDVAWLGKAMARQYQDIASVTHPDCTAFPVGYDRPVGDGDKPLGAIIRTRKDIYALQLWLPWRGRKGENGRYHPSVNVLLADLFGFCVRRLDCTTFEDAVRETNALGATIAAWRSGLAAVPIKKALLIGCGDAERPEPAHGEGCEASRAAEASCVRPQLETAA